MGSRPVYFNFKSFSVWEHPVTSLEQQSSFLWPG